MDTATPHQHDDPPAQPAAGSQARSAGGEPTVAAPESETAASVVEGMRPAPPIRGFGKLWRKTYRVRLGAGVEPATVIATWKEHFDRFWPEGNTFYAPLTGLRPGELALLDLDIAGGVPLSTGVVVASSDVTSFTLVTTQGHFFSGWISFSATEEAGVTLAQVEALVRASDPLFEIGLMLGGSKKEDLFWRDTLRSLAAHFGAPGARVQLESVLVDKRRHWSRIGNIRHNTGVRSLAYRARSHLGSAVGAVRRRIGRQRA